MNYFLPLVVMHQNAAQLSQGESGYCQQCVKSIPFNLTVMLFHVLDVALPCCVVVVLLNIVCKFDC